MSEISNSVPEAAFGSPARRFFRLLKDALTISKQDFTVLPINRALAVLALPMVLEMLMQSLFSIVDIFFVAHLGAQATATVGITEGLMMIVSAISGGLSLGAAALIARRVGEHDEAGAAATAIQCIFLGLAVSALLCAVCYPLSSWFLLRMGATPQMLRVGSTYTRLILSGAGTVVLLFMMNAVFRGAGDAAIAMRALWIANYANLLFVPCFILGLGPFPRLGLTGAAVGTLLGRCTGLAYQASIIFRDKCRIKIHSRHFHPQPRILGPILKIAGNGALQVLISTASWLFLVKLIQDFGSTATAGYTIALRIMAFSTLPSWGLGAAAGTLVGQNLGAKRPERAEQAVWRAGFFNMVFLGLVSLLILFRGHSLLGLFSADAGVINVGATCLRIISVCFVPYAYGLVIMQCLNGAGDTFTPVIINFVSYWIIQLPLAFLLSRSFHLGVNGVFAAISATNMVLAAMAGYLFKIGRWKRMSL
jgi:putative MATE family efflux protein